jgi:hypothetical protein
VQTFSLAALNSNFGCAKSLPSIQNACLLRHLEYCP